MTPIRGPMLSFRAPTRGDSRSNESDSQFEDGHSRFKGGHSGLKVDCSRLNEVGSSGDEGCSRMKWEPVRKFVWRVKPEDRNR